MSTPRDLAIPLERITWRDGQTLTSRDLRDDQLYVESLRHLHIRCQHNTWGVVEGLGVSSFGGRPVVAPGYALDNEGRELLLPQIVAVPVPANVHASTTMYMVISWSTQQGRDQAPPGLVTLCPGVQDLLPVQRASLAWKTVTEVRVGSDVLLARALVADGKLDSDLDTSVRRFATTMNQPLLWSGATLAGQTGWADSTINRVPEIQATVDTSDGGFLTTPCYFAALIGGSAVASGYITSISAASFTFLVRPNADLPGGSGVDAAKAESDAWTVSWLGIELSGNG